jgi:hypothetical protein
VHVQDVDVVQAPCRSTNLHFRPCSGAFRGAQTVLSSWTLGRTSP